MDRNETSDTDFPAGDLLQIARRAHVREGELAQWYTGGAGYVIRSARSLVLIDPYVGPSNPPDWIRAIPPAFDPEKATIVDAIVLSHEHSDHADPAALGPLARRTEAVVVGSSEATEIAARAGWPADRRRAMAPGESATIGDIRLTAVAVNDPSARGANGYVLEAGAVSVLHCGDSLYFPWIVDFARQWSFDAICVSVGLNPPGQTYYMDEAAAARMGRDSGARILIPQHFDLWRGLTLDPIRVTTVARWYCPNTRVLPARLARRVSIRTRKTRKVVSSAD